MIPISRRLFSHERPSQRTIMAVIAGVAVLFPIGSSSSTQTAETHAFPVSSVFEGTSTSGATVTLALTHEVLYDANADPLFNRPSVVYIGPDDRIYVLDQGDQDVKVLDSDGNHLHSIGRAGFGPGEFETVNGLALAASGNIWVFDRTALRLQQFSPDGAYLATIRVPRPSDFPTSPVTMAMAGDDVFLVAAASLHEPFHGFGIHAFRIVKGQDEELTLSHLRSFGEVPSYDPAIYETIASGNIFVESDDSVFYAPFNPYDLQRYTLDGTLLWRLEDADALAPAATYFDLAPTGRIRLRSFPYSAALVPLHDGFLLHFMVIPSRERSPDGSIGFQRFLEVIATAGSQTIWRARIEMDEPLIYRVRDNRGRLYGFYRGDDTELFIRSTLDLRVTTTQ